jgi:hypothetical protein
MIAPRLPVGTAIKTKSQHSFLPRSVARQRDAGVIMSKQIITAFLSVVVLAVLPLISEAYDDSTYSPTHFKQLAGPPAEFAAMAAPDPAKIAIHSKSALLAIDLQPSVNGIWTWQTAIPVEGETLRFGLITPASDSAAHSWKVFLQEPGTMRKKAVDAWFARSQSTDFGLSENRYPAQLYELESPTPGWWQISIESREQDLAFLVIEGAGPARLVSHLASFNQRVGERIGIVARIDDGSGHIDSPISPQISEAILRVRTPSHQVLTSSMFDDGLHHDGKAGDGVFGGDFLAHRAGDFNVQIVVSGNDRSGIAFLRTAEHLIPVTDDIMGLSDQVAACHMVSPNRLDIRLEVVAPEATGHYRAYAEVWGTDPRDPGQEVPVAWIGGMTPVRDEVLHLGLDTRWIQLAGAQPPFELRNLRIEGPDHFITISSSERVPLAAPALPKTLTPAQQIVVDEEMLMGPRPASWTATGIPGAFDQKSYLAGEGHQLLLVHGYCSSDVWGSVADQFTDASVFLDLKQNRSVDHFALLIRAWAEQWNSYAMVAHSQGGMASLHLYTYYWSGLDNAGPGRLIQSVGTPYQGSPLSGILAEIGSWFGVSCGMNSGLTKLGAALWLAQIPQASRAGVNYHTTSFTDVWWRWDYCHLVTDLLLADPDDGVVEKAFAQLPGGVNQGHKTGWCHSVDMRDPAQYHDADRNATMDATAAIGPPPAAFLLTNPADGLSLDPQTTSVSLSWEWASGASSYEVYFGNAPNPPLVATQSTTSHDVSVSPGTTYYWNVLAKNLYGQTWSSNGAWSFSVGDFVPPVIDSLVARPDRLWPPNHRMVNVNLEVAVTDNYDPSPYCHITDVLSSEAVSGVGQGDRSPDWQVTGDFTLDLRAERFGHGVGRIYTVEVTCSDYSGNQASEVVVILVPHDQSTKLIFYNGFESGDPVHWSTTRLR